MENGKIRLTPVEQRYIASCSPLPDRIFYDEAIKWKEILRKSAIDDKLMEVPVTELTKPFPNITRLYFEGLFKTRSVQDYFEGADIKSHNLRMYSYAKKALKLPEIELLAVLSHIEQCSVRIAWAETDNLATVFSYKNNYGIELDKEYLDIHPVTECVFIHGKSEKGAIVVRGAEDFEVKEVMDWFENIQKNPKNPFLKYVDKLR